MNRRRSVRTTAKTRGLTLAEVSVATLLVGLTLVAALNVVGAVRRTDATTRNHALAVHLAEDLLSEVLNSEYGTAGVPQLGATSRSGFDDLDDYDGWSESPPTDADGNQIEGTTGWTRSVAVDPVDETMNVTGSESGYKRVVVTVLGPGVEFSLTALRVREFSLTTEFEP